MHLDREACYQALLTRDGRFDGRFFTCVETTGVYCRPICPARPPKLETIIFVSSAAAAQEAGFRPCLRCRPETSPDTAAWHGRTPRTIRRGGVTEAAGSAITLSLPYKPPYDWPAITGFLAARAIPGVEHVRPDRYARTIALRGAHGMIAVRQADRREGNALVATIRFPDVTALPAIVERIRRIFDLGADPAIIAAHLSADPYLARLVAARPGLRVPGAWDGFELAVRGILGQQISVGAATRLAGKLITAYGVPFPSPRDAPGLSHVFPAPDQVPGGDLAAVLGVPRARAAAIVSVATAAAANPRLFEPGQGIDDAITRLKALRGIGEWTANYIAMRALREPDAFPAADIGLLRALATEKGRPKPAELLNRAAAWRPWRAYAAMHLWTAASGKEGKGLAPDRALPVCQRVARAK